MKFTCDQCQAQYMISDEKVGPKGVKVRCKKCSNIITVKKDEAAAAAPEAPAPAAPAGGGSFDDMFGNQPSDDESYERQPTKVFTSQDLQKVRDEQMRAQGSAPTDAAHVAAPSAPQHQAPVGDPNAGFASVPGMAETPEWYVAINDEQVGPITMGDLETRWDRGEVRADTLAWRNGLPDWHPVNQVSELSRLLSRPQASSAPKQLPTFEQPAAAKPAEVEKPAEKPAVTWRPSGASALADLVKTAVEEPKKTEPVAAANPFSGGSFPSNDPAPVADPFASLPSFAPNQSGPQTMWQMPSQMAPRPSNGGGSKTLIIVLGVLLFVAVGLGGLFATGVIGRPAPVAVVPPPQPSLAAVVPPPVASAPVVAVPQPSAPVAASAPAPSAPVAPVASGAVAAAPVGKKGKGGKGTAATPAPAGGEPAAPVAPPPKKKADGGLGDLFGDKPAAAEPPKSNLKPTLDKPDVFGVVKANFPNIRSCVDKYIASGGGKALPPKLLLKFVIVPSGGTTSQEMASPELKGTSVEPCVVGVIKSFKFPEFQSGTIPVSFPFALGQ